MCDWVCYLIASLDSNRTYVGSTNNQPKRLNTHNSGYGAKATKGQIWIPIVTISGFHHKNACLSFEAGWKRLSKTRSNEKLHLINVMTDLNLDYYHADTKWDRIMDLVYFMHNFTLLDTKFMINYNIQHPVNQPDELKINIFMEDWIADLPWPHFVTCKSS